MSINAEVIADCAHCTAVLVTVKVYDKPVAVRCNSCGNFTLVELKLDWRKLVDSKNL